MGVQAIYVCKAVNVDKFEVMTMNLRVSPSIVLGYSRLTKKVFRNIRVSP